jgi:hypothetical protein
VKNRVSKFAFKMQRNVPLYVPAAFNDAVGITVGLCTLESS